MLWMIWRLIRSKIVAENSSHLVSPFKADNKLCDKEIVREKCTEWL